MLSLNGRLGVTLEAAAHRRDSDELPVHHDPEVQENLRKLDQIQAQIDKVFLNAFQELAKIT